MPELVFFWEPDTPAVLSQELRASSLSLLFPASRWGCPFPAGLAKFRSCSNSLLFSFCLPIKLPLGLLLLKISSSFCPLLHWAQGLALTSPQSRDTWFSWRKLYPGAFEWMYKERADPVKLKHGEGLFWGWQKWSNVTLSNTKPWRGVENIGRPRWNHGSVVDLLGELGQVILL